MVEHNTCVCANVTRLWLVLLHVGRKSLSSLKPLVSEIQKRFEVGYYNSYFKSHQPFTAAFAQGSRI